MKKSQNALAIFTFLLGASLTINPPATASLETAVAQTELITKVIITASKKVKKKNLSISADNDLYLAKKVKIKGKKITIPIIVDPSITSGSLIVTATIKDQVLSNSIEPSLIASQKNVNFNTETGKIDMTASLIGKKTKGFLLKAGEGTSIKKAIRLKGKANSNNDTVSFKLKSELEDGVIYTMIFKDKANVFFGSFSK